MSASSLSRRLEANLREQAELREEEAILRAQLQSLADEHSAAAVTPDQSVTNWSASFDWDAAVQDLLATRFGHSSFRPLQREVINAVLSGNDVFAVMPTGAGKSLTFQLPALLKGGLTVVVSPLISLMQDQVSRLQDSGVRAELLSAELCDRSASTRIQQEAADPAGSGLRFLYVTPERVAKSKMLLAKLQKCYQLQQLTLICVDEAHCCAAQGHDFRPDYLALGTLRSSFGQVPILALTATASNAVRSDVEATLQMTAQRIVRFRGHFDRPNIRYTIRPKPADSEALISQIAEIASRWRGSPGIVYTLSRADAEKTAASLQKVTMQ